MKQVLEEKIGIPMGTNLRLLLHSEHISQGEINSVLKGKGIFVGSSEKVNTVHLLGSTLLTPDDYAYLVEACESRELRPKTKTATYKLTSPDADWTTPVREHLEERLTERLQLFENVHFIQKPSIEFLSPNSIKVTYAIRRKDFSKEWIERNLDFHANFELYQDGDTVDLKCASTHSAKETEQINQSMMQATSKLLHELQVTMTEQPRQIRFDSFTNTERVRYFKRLISGTPPLLTVGEVENIEISLDPNNAELPDDPQISWMKTVVKRVSIDGEKMNEIFLLADETYYEYYHIQKMDVTFPFKDGTNSGKFRASFYFSGSARTPEEGARREVAHTRGNLNFKTKPNSEAKQLMEKKVDKALRKLVDLTFDQILLEREAAALAAAQLGESSSP